MSEGAGPAASKPTAGSLLREAREKQGLHIAALATAIKVAPKKLEMLESDRFDQLPDATFTRALAQTVCRALKIDSGPIMQLLPPPSGHRLEHVGEGLNTPFRERPGALVQRDWKHVAANPLFWVVALILVATAAVYFLPASFVMRATTRPRLPAAEPAPVEPGASFAAAGAASAASAGPAPTDRAGLEGRPASSPAPAAEVEKAAPGLAVNPAAVDVAASAPSAPALLQLRTSASSWVEVSDASGKILLSRLLAPGETVGVDGVPPLKVRIGNAAGTELVFRGQVTDLQAFTRDNVARLELR